MKNRVEMMIMAGILSLCTSCARRSENAEVDSNTETMMEYMGYADCDILRLGNYIGVSYETVEYSISEHEIQAALCNMEDYAEKIPVENRTWVEKGDYIVVDYEIIYDGAVLKQCANEVVHVGENKYDDQFENNIIGAHLNEVYTMDWTVLDNPNLYGGYEELAGKTVTIEAVVREIYGLKQVELTDAFVQKEFGVDTVEGYYDQVYNELAEMKEKAAHDAEIDAIFEKIIMEGQYDLDENAVVKHAANLYRSYEYNAYLYNMELEEYAQVFFGTGEDDLYNIAYEESCDEIKYYLTVGAIIKALELEVTEEERISFCERYDADFEKMTDEEKCYMYYDILEEKVLNFVYENATCQ